MADVLEVQKREQTGSAATTRLRRSGKVPAVLYGHGEANQHLAIPQAQVKMVVRHHTKMVQLSGDVKDTALVSNMQWDALGIEVLHLDLIRVNLKESVEVTISIHAHGDPVGVREGGIFVENVHDVEVRCPAGAIPENLRLDINDLHMGHHLTVADLELPDGVEMLTPLDTVIAHVEQPREEEDETGEDGLGVEPDVIVKGGEKNDED